MIFHQKRFFAYPSGAPFLHTLSSVSSSSYALVTTDRSVSLLSYGEAGYRLQQLKINDPQSEEPNVVASAAIELPRKHQSRVAVAYAVGEAHYLQVFAPRHEYLDNAEALEVSSCAKFELEAAPTCMFYMQALGTKGKVFYGVIVCCTDSMVAIGYIVNEKEDLSIASCAACTRLNNDQFAAFFPEFATFAHTVVAVDIVLSPEKDQGWIAFGCADGLVRVFQGQTHEGILSGPFTTKDLQLNGFVTSVALYLKRAAISEDATSNWRCNLLVTCAIGQALVYEDLFGPFNHIGNGEVLVDSDKFDSIFTGVIADIDLDGEVELLLGTDRQVMLAYKERSEDEGKHKSSIIDDLTNSLLDPLTESIAASGNGSPLSTGSTRNIWDDLETIPVIDEGVPPAPESSLARWKWQRLAKTHWDLETFGAIYSLLWRDVNQDGVPELLVASSTGIYVYEADAVFVIKKLECVLAALTTTSA